MAIFPLYRDFFRFLEGMQAGGDPWEIYQDVYLRPHRDFLKAYWSAYFPGIDVHTLRDRVRQVRRGHYAVLEHLVAGNDVDGIVAGVIELCRRWLPAIPEPDVYLMVGFFSADGFLVGLRGRPVIGIGLERYRDLRPLDIILAHEYCHFARQMILGGSGPDMTGRLDEKLFSEGLGVYFSRQVFPGRSLGDHLLISRQRLNWCRENESMLLELVRGRAGDGDLIPELFGTGGFGRGLPPRTGMYLGYRLVEEVMVEGERSFEDLLAFTDVAAVWPWGG
jgi:hypothetical protein